MFVIITAGVISFALLVYSIYRCDGTLESNRIIEKRALVVICINVTFIAVFNHFLIAMLAWFVAGYYWVKTDVFGISEKKAE